MCRSIIVKRLSTQEVIHEPVIGIHTHQVYSENYFCQRFALLDVGIVGLTLLDGESEIGRGKSVPFQTVDGTKKLWTLTVGCTYNVVAVGDVDSLRPFIGDREKQKLPVDVMELFEDSYSGDNDLIILGATSPLCLSENSFPGSKEDIVVEDAPVVEVRPIRPCITIDPEKSQLRMYRISALETILGVKGYGEIFRFVKEGAFSTQQVSVLPNSYNGNVIFELPPIEGDLKKGDRVRSMERAKDCFYWTRIVPTSAQVPRKNLWEFGKVTCTGALQCKNDTCPHFTREGFRNSFSWTGNYKMATLHKVGIPMEVGGLVCGFCDERPFCVSACPAKMFYMYPKNVLPEGIERGHMSRLAIHQGEHVHKPRQVFSRESLQKVEVLIGKHQNANPSAMPSRIRNVAIGELVSLFQPDSAVGLGEDEQTELWESLQIMSSPQKFTSLLRNVRKDCSELKGNGMFDALRRMQENSIFPYIQRYRVPGQGSEKDFPFTFKMSVKGFGSGVDILQRMKPGENLFGTWVMFDVMRQITTGWLTFSAHVYDHNYLSLCTIFTCELMAEDAASCQVAWLQMIDVARQYGISEVYIHGFMADNAIGGWNAVRTVFFGGTRDPERERSDAFHWAQSLTRHTREGIKETSRAEHVTLWKKIRDAKNVVEAYKISHKISAWWRAGNCYPEKLNML